MNSILLMFNNIVSFWLLEVNHMMYFVV